MIFLPWPTKLNEINEILNNSKENEPKHFKSTERNALEIQVLLTLYPDGLDKKLEVREFPDEKNNILNAYSIIRSMVQCNEAINKLISTIELLHASSPTIKNQVCLCSLFSIDYCGGTIIPTLYYSTISALTSLLSSFGCVSEPDRNSNKRYNLVRTSEGWKLFQRKEYIKNLHGSSSSSWHTQVFQLTQGLKKHSKDFPNIDLEDIKKLSSSRNITHYEILGSMFLSDVKGLYDYFKTLPLNINIINHTLAVIRFTHNLL